jgi:hypothetical protein
MKEQSMKKYLLVLLSVSLLNTLAIAAAGDVNAETKVEQKTTKNPLTGTVTTKRKYKKQHSDTTGSANDTVTEKTKVYKDGSTSQKVESESNDKTK